MKRVLPHLTAFVAGVVFSAGLILSGMIHPAKVLGFLDVAGDWDPTLAFVMAGGIAVHAIAHVFIVRRGRPLFATSPFPGLTRTRVDGRLVAGSALFGIGWGLVGVCPGPAVVTLSSGAVAIVPFFLAMLAGMALHRVWARATAASTAAPAAPTDDAVQPALETSPSS